MHNYEEMFLTSKFCIAPYGYGWGLRLAIAVVHGCIPVIIQVGRLAGTASGRIHRQDLIDETLLLPA